jgi:hypothetical protein
LGILSSSQHDAQQKSEAKKYLKFISQRILLRVGEQYGRAGLNSVRRQIGAAPSARRPSRACVGAEFSGTVYQLAEAYQELSAAEREAFKSLAQGVDKKRKQSGCR